MSKLPIILITLYSNIVCGMQPSTWTFGFPTPATEIMEHVISAHSFVMIVMISIMLFIWILIAYIIFRFRKSKVVNISNTTHSTALEVIWFIIPTIIIGILSFKNAQLIILQDKIPKTDITLKVIGHQWYWSYLYPEYNNLSFNSYLKDVNDLTEEGDLKLLSVDNKVILPTNTNILLQIISADVIHSWGISAFGIKIDAIPGRLNESWFNIKTPGTYYGQCYELCGPGHGFMPIVVEAVSRDEFDNWIEDIKLKGIE
ncbi:cytochrome c oxidase subunit II [Wolbachia endosymbiont of Howardula sp.]|uniref:cytochrome c oxidase subunit II n=1 Tax=Wolbachia endosymbiont of Howardula sp. TaxID=2916816 RepID=UPI0031FC4254